MGYPYFWKHPFWIWLNRWNRFLLLEMKFSNFPHLRIWWWNMMNIVHLNLYGSFCFGRFFGVWFDHLEYTALKKEKLRLSGCWWKWRLLSVVYKKVWWSNSKWSLSNFGWVFDLEGWHSLSLCLTKKLRNFRGNTPSSHIAEHVKNLHKNQPLHFFRFSSWKDLNLSVEASEVLSDWMQSLLQDTLVKAERLTRHRQAQKQESKTRDREKEMEISVEDLSLALELQGFIGKTECWGWFKKIGLGEHKNMEWPRIHVAVRKGSCFCHETGWLPF